MGYKEPEGSNNLQAGSNSNGGGAAAVEKDAAAVSGWRSDGSGAATGCRKGHKVLVPWRFGFKRRPWSQGNGSRGPPGTYRSSRQCAHPAAKSRLRVVSAAVRNRSTLKKVQTGPVATASVIRKKKGVKKAVVVDHHQEMPRNRLAPISRETAMAALHEFRVLRERFSVERQHDDRRYVGSVPGVEVGDVFGSDAELRFVGLHRSQGSCVDYIISNKGGSTCLAVSVVSEYVQHAHKDNHPELLLHIAHKMGGTEEELALKQSMDTKTPVRVIYWVVADHEAAGNSQSDELPCYVYAGLYTVERKDHGTDTYQLKRISGQPQINIQELAEKRPPQLSIGTFVTDISSSLEKIPVSLINSIDNEYPAAFVYIVERQHHPMYQLYPPSGCDCIGGCSDSPDCSCAVKNGGEIPFSDDGRILGDKPLVYECGPSCKCPPTCHNKVSQHIIKFRLQVFKTTLMGWGVRCLDYIPAGSFVCEYVGELLDDEEAEEKENDMYFFNTGDNYFNVPRWDGLVKTIPSLRNGPREDEADVFVVDALKRGNVARFINHSCTPNLYPQSVLYDHDDIRMTHIMFFACDDIPPLQPLSIDYNYTLDGVRDAEDNIKKKLCFCGSSKCRGRLY